VLSLVGAGAANASGGYYRTDVTCDSLDHTIQMQGSVLAAPGGGYVQMQFWVYSYKTRQWIDHSQWYTSTYQTNKPYTIIIPAFTVPTGRYYVEVDYAWFGPDW
jgi:hypothetical protein